MRLKNFKFYFYTIIQLKFFQIFFRIFYTFRNKYFGRILRDVFISKDSQKLNFFSFFIKNPNSLHAKSITFDFLN